MADETKVREFLDMPGLETYDGAMKGYVDNANKTLTTAVNVLEASKLDIQVQQNLTEEAKALGRTNLGAASKSEFEAHVGASNPHGLTYETIGADKSGTASSTVSTHNVNSEAHADIRVLINDLKTKVNDFLDVDDATTDQLSEVLAMIENNKGTLESLTTSKVNVVDIIDNLTTNSSDKVLSAAQGVALKALIDNLQTTVESKQNTITGTAGQFVVIGDDGNVTAKTVPNAEEVAF